LPRGGSELRAHGRRGRPAGAKGSAISAIDPGADIGHVHLKVSDLDRAVAFYRDALGFEVTGQLGAEAAFLSAGGYHHHVGLNIWAAGSPVATEDDAKLLDWELVLPDPISADKAAQSLEQAGAPLQHDANSVIARDPWNIAVRLTGLRAV
jgi:catechol 2,3-dioxygenase